MVATHSPPLPPPGMPDVDDEGTITRTQPRLDAIAPDLPTHLVTAEQVAAGRYCGPDLSDWAGHIEIAAGLGRVAFPGRLRAAGGIRALVGSGIKAGDGIKAGLGIKAGEGIEAGLSIRCKWVDAHLRIFAGLVNWRSLDLGDDEIHGEIRSGAVALGRLVSPGSATP